jgi:hypothetical protein
MPHSINKLPNPLDDVFRWFIFDSRSTLKAVLWHYGVYIPMRLNAYLHVLPLIVRHFHLHRPRLSWDYMGFLFKTAIFRYELGISMLGPFYLPYILSVLFMALDKLSEDRFRSISCVARI